MFSTTKQQLVPREKIYEMLTKEDEYAGRWGEGKTSMIPGFPDHMVSRESGQPYGILDIVTWAEFYLRQAKDAHASFCPDTAAIRIRVLKAASLLVTALQIHAEEEDLNRIAGISSTKFPILYGGVDTFENFIHDQAAMERLYDQMKTPVENRTELKDSKE